MLYLPFFHGQNISFCYTTDRKLMFWVFFFFFLSVSTFFTDKKFVYFFHSKNVSFCNSICRHWMFLNVYFSCLSTSFTSWYLVFLFSLRECFVLLHHMGKLYFSSCLRFSKIGTMSIIFTVRIFRSITPKAGNLRVIHVYFFTPVYLFH